MKRLNDAKFIKGVVNDQLEKDFDVRCGFSEIKTNELNEYYVEFNVYEVNDNIQLLIDDIQSIARVSCIKTKILNGTSNIRFF